MKKPFRFKGERASAVPPCLIRKREACQSTHRCNGRDPWSSNCVGRRSRPGLTFNDPTPRRPSAALTSYRGLHPVTPVLWRWLPAYSSGSASLVRIDCGQIIRPAGLPVKQLLVWYTQRTRPAGVCALELRDHSSGRSGGGPGMAHPFLERLARGPILADGALGSLLCARGASPEQRLEELTLSQPDW